MATACLSLTQTSGGRAEYISDVQVTIKDKSGNTVLDADRGGTLYADQARSGQILAGCDL